MRFDCRLTIFGPRASISWEIEKRKRKAEEKGKTEASGEVERWANANGMDAERKRGTLGLAKIRRT